MKIALTFLTFLIYALTVSAQSVWFWQTQAATKQYLSPELAGDFQHAVQLGADRIALDLLHDETLAPFVRMALRGQYGYIVYDNPQTYGVAFIPTVEDLVDAVNLTNLYSDSAVVTPNNRVILRKRFTFYVASNKRALAYLTTGPKDKPKTDMALWYDGVLLGADFTPGKLIGKGEVSDQTAWELPADVNGLSFASPSGRLALVFKGDAWALILEGNLAIRPDLDTSLVDQEGGRTYLPSDEAALSWARTLALEPGSRSAYFQILSRPSN